MISPENLVAFVLAGLLLNVTPGPDVLYIVARGASQGRAAGLVSALGITAGCFVHIAAAVAGMSTLMMRLPAVYEAVRWLGAAYLIFLGLRALLKRTPSPLVPQTVQPTNLGRIFRQGMVTNALNPKVALFFAAFLPQFVDLNGGAVTTQFLVLGLIFNVNSFFVNAAYALLASRFGGWLRTRFAAANILDRVAGGVFIALGIRLALAERR
jgi:threonine/homoserine/homoserine lactone efflux protein